MKALGVQVVINDSTISISVSNDKITQWIQEITSILRIGKLSPALAKKIAGKLQWGATEVFGKGARA
jgi:hypothetical protein